jgi:flavin reductase (DIM6/NTAB) family NADH-FMN oxidoreductase RutF
MNNDPTPALGRVASGIFILTAGQGDAATGMLASWVMQAGFDPPMVTVAIRSGRYVGDWLADGAPFTLNIVADKQTHLLKHFGKGFEPGEPAFEGLEVAVGDNGVPALVETLGRLECTPLSHLESGDHRIFLARVVGGALASDAPPMVHVRKSGAHY